MKKIIYTLAGIIALAPSSLIAQRICGSNDHYQHMLQTDVEFATQRKIIEQQTQAYEANPTKPTRVLKTIPVVVHVVYNTATQNISDAQIQSQIDVMNADFRKLNADWTGTPSVFQGLVADCEIEFCLAKQDPNGAASTGIVRKSTTTTSFSTNDAVKSSSTGGDNAWNAAKYLNLWVCNLSGGVLGYAQFPGGAASTDGVVITYTGFGTNGTAAAPFNKGRTATHEVGHWLNLYHIWGDDGTGCSGSDLVGDTPNQADENYGCPVFPAVSCSNGPNGDMFMNYMDYSDDACMFMFTTGQKARMDALFATGGSRVGLLTSQGCVVPSANSCGSSASLSTTAITATSATLNWAAVTNATSYNVQYKLASASTWTTLVATTTSQAVSGLTAASAYQFQVQAVCASGTGIYSSIGTFTTLTAGGTGCSNNYEANNTRATAIAIASNTTITSMLGTSTDKDYYSFTTTTAAPKLKVTLSTLPGDYDLKLYNSAGTLLATSQNGSTTSETISYNSSTVGSTYYAYVYGYNGAFSATQCYTLATVTSASNLKIEKGDLTAKAELNIFPSPATQKVGVQFFALGNENVVMNMYNALGQKVMNQNVTTVEGENNIYFDVNTLSNGIYILEMLDGTERKMQKFTIQK
jgi:hypothetical protein